MRTIILLLRSAALAAAVFACAGCHDGGYDHTPPAGKGAIVVDNITADHIEVYVDGTMATNVNNGTYDIVDLEPGVHRVVLNDEDEYRSYRDDVDVLAGKLTVLEVHMAGDWRSYNAVVTFE